MLWAGRSRRPEGNRPAHSELPASLLSATEDVDDMAQMTEAAWSRLLAMVCDGTVVPILGPRLLVEADGTTPMQARVASRLLANYDVDVPDGGLARFREVNEAVTLLKGKVDVQELYFPIYQAIVELQAQQAEIPKSVRKLAEISDFRLFVTLTPDDLLAQALHAARRAVDEIVHSPKLPTDQGADLPTDWQKPGGAVQLLYLFGKARPSPLFAIHDEDLLEYAHNIIASGSHAPKAFLGALQDRNLLLVGCNFPDWLSRFMLRVTRKGRLADQQGSRGWLVEPLGREDPFIGFLGKYSPATSVLTDIEPAEFVDELHSRWMTEHRPRTVGAAAPTERPMPESAMFFISYSRPTDLARAARLHGELLKLGVSRNEIWFDETEIDPADKVWERARDGIRGCRYFLALVSRAATERERGFVFREWNEATRMLPELNRPFLVPLVVDPDCAPESYRQASVREWFEQHIKFGHAPEGAPDASVGEFLKKLVRAARPSL